jgi:chromosome segregation protein
MYLSKLQLFGFKSFAQKTNLKFNDGISCVIGPNGSGKSNIVDAIRWVLGEQRVTLLRSDKMENVLFNGTKQRKPIGMAEVSLTIQNNKNILNTEYNEVVISRRLYRSGESQYLINKTVVRLKDVLDIFMDTGMGANSYSVIELKMVESILSENRQERRQLFEEAAGVVKYKIRRKSALRKLDAARSDLTRVNDIIIEVEKNVNSLSRQVGKARRYLSYTEDLKKTDIDLSRFRYHGLLNEIRPLQTQLQEASKLKEESHHQITIDEALLEDYKRELIKTEQSLQQINQKLHEQDTNIAQIKQDEAVAQTKSEEITKTKERYKIEIDDFSQKTSVLEDNLKHYEDELSSLISQKETFDAQYAEIEKERISEVEKLQSEKTDIDKLNNDFRSHLQLISNEKERLKQKEYQFKFQKEQLISLEKSKATHSETINSLEKETKRINDEKAVLKDKFNQLNNELNSLETKAEKLQNDQRTFENERNQNLSELERAKSRLHFFQQIISNYEGHSQSAKFAMAKKDQFAG